MSATVLAVARVVPTDRAWSGPACCALFVTAIDLTTGGDEGARGPASRRALSSAPLRAHHLFEARRRDAGRSGSPHVRRDVGCGGRTGVCGALRDDRHHFRFIISPEDAAELGDLRTFTRELMTDVARDLGTKLDLIAVDHWNTDNPHIHVLIRGRAEDGQDLVISRDYISRGFRDRAAERVTLELGPRSEREIRTPCKGRLKPSAGPASIGRCVSPPTKGPASRTFDPARQAKTRTPPPDGRTGTGSNVSALPSRLHLVAGPSNPALRTDCVISQLAAMSSRRCIVR